VNCGPRRAAHPVHESVTTTQIYLQADMALKQRALDRTTPPASIPGRYKPGDQLLAFLEAL
jgi:integrase/recombinase XerD